MSGITLAVFRTCPECLSERLIMRGEEDPGCEVCEFRSKPLNCSGCGKGLAPFAFNPWDADYKCFNCLASPASRPTEHDRSEQND